MVICLSTENHSPINIRADYDSAFKRAYHNDCIETAKRLFNLSNIINNPINIHADGDYIFKFVCGYIIWK
jgi:hypothetical protein